MIIQRPIAATLFGLAVTLALTPCDAATANAAGGSIRIDHPWSRPTPPSAPTAVGYLTIVNRARTPDRLIAVSSPAAAEVSVHSMTMAGGVMRMRPVDGGLPIPPESQVTLGPDGDHLMFMGLRRPFRPGERIPVSLTFAHAGRARTALVVTSPHDAPPPAAMPAMPGMDMR